MNYYTKTNHRWRNTFVMTATMFLCFFVLLTARMVIGQDPVVKPKAAALTTEQQASASNSYTWDGSGEGSDNSSSDNSGDYYGDDSGTSSSNSNGSSSNAQSMPTPQPNTSAS